MWGGVLGESISSDDGIREITPLRFISKRKEYPRRGKRPRLKRKRRFAGKQKALGSVINPKRLWQVGEKILANDRR